MSVSIDARGVWVEYPVLSAENRSLRKALVNRTTLGKVSIDARSRVTVRALKEITFQLREGDRLGLIGRNGAGKSTLLRALAGVYEPTRGILDVSGTVAPLLNLGVGIRDDSTGYENIRLCGYLLGMSRTEVERKVDDIAEFTELGEYLSMPLHTYSAGMRMRLAFAISTAVEPNILLIDETVGAGDAAFLKKAEARLNELIQRSGIVVLATHSNEMIRRDCTLAMLLRNGEMVRFGDVGEVVAQYEQEG